MILDLTVKGRPRKVIAQAAKNGFFYILDRATGEFISAAPFVKVNWAVGIDEKGRPIVSPETYYDTEGVEIFPTGGGRGGGGIGGGTVTTAGNLVFQTINDGRSGHCARIRA